MSVSSRVWEAWSRYLAHGDAVRSRFLPEIVLEQQTANLVAVEVRVPLTALACEADGVFNRKLPEYIYKRIPTRTGSSIPGTTFY